VNISRRTFIAAGVVGVVALAATRFLPRSSLPAGDPSLRALDPDGAAIVTALVPAMLAGALPEERSARAAAVADTVAAIDGAILGLPPQARLELDQLFTLLASLPGRMLLAHRTSAWSAMPEADAHAFLERLRESRFTLLRSAYDALHQLVLASWYGQPRAWAAIGYAGPPAIG
jgi:hypothetical protein